MKALAIPVRKLWPRLKFLKSRSNFKVKVTRSKNFCTCGNVSPQEMYICNIEALRLLVRELSPRLKIFLEVGRTSRSRLLGQKLWYPWKGLVTRNVHMRYEGPTFSG